MSHEVTTKSDEESPSDYLIGKKEGARIQCAAHELSGEQILAPVTKTGETCFRDIICLATYGW